MLFDSHAHVGELTDSAFIATASTSEMESASAYRYKALGIIPEGNEKDLDKLEAAAKDGWHIGEIGLDRRFPDMKEQEYVFRRALSVAIEHDRMAIIHVVRAYGPLYDILSDMNVRRFLVHGYTGSVEMAERLIGQGGIISLSPRAERTRDFKGLLTLPFVTETDMPTGPEQRRVLKAWNERLSELTGEDIGERSGRIMRESLC